MTTASTPPRSRSSCQINRASPLSLQACRASRSSQEPGNWTTPQSIRRRRCSLSRSPRSTGWRAASRRAPATSLDRRPPARPCARLARVRPPRSRAPATPARPPCPADRGSPPSAGSGPLPSPLEGALRNPLVGLDVLGARLLDHVGRQLGRRRLVVPTGGIGPVAHELLVEGRLRLARLVAVSGPEARGVGSEDLVAEDDLGAGVGAKLELGVGEDDPPLGRVLGAAPVDLGRDPTQLLHQRPVADDLSRPLEIDVLVVIADLGLGCGGEDRLRQLGGLEPVGRQLNSTNRPASLILLAARSEEIAAHD